MAETNPDRVPGDDRPVGDRGVLHDHFDGEVIDRHMSFKRIAQLTLAVVLLTALSMPVVIRYASNAASNSSAVRAGTEITACQNLYSNDISEATQALDDARDQRDQFEFDLLQLSLQGDREATRRLISDRAPLIPKAIAEATAAKRLAVEVRSAANKLSVSDPEAFIAQCREKAHR